MIRAARSPAEALERFLGDPDSDVTPLNYESSLRLDELEQFPSAAFEALNAWGLAEYFIPPSQGGALSNFEEALHLLRVLSRRDLTAAVAQGQTYLGAVHVWLAGSDAQKLQVKEIIHARGSLAFALTEREHGSDILSSEVLAEPYGNGYLLSGEKWLINNGTRATALTVFARTEGTGGPRGFSLFLVDKSLLPVSGYEHLSKIRTHGLRGADISGIRFKQCLVPAGALVGPAGSGLEIALKGLSITRAMCAGFSMGCLDTALRVTLQFAQSRVLYQDKVWNIPHARSCIVDAFADLICCECVSLLAARALHLQPGQFSIYSSATKYLVPEISERAINKLSTVLGARHYLRDSIFQKMMRDNAIVGLFDGSSVVNLNAIALQLPHLLRLPENSGDDPKLFERLGELCSLGSPLPEFDPSGMKLSSGGKHDLIAGMLALSSGSVSKVERPMADPEAAEWIDDLTQTAVNRLRQLSLTLAADLKRDRQAGPFRSVEMLWSAGEFCSLHAAAALVCLWNQWKNEDPFFGSGIPVAMCLHRLLGGKPRQLSPRFTERTAQQLEHLLAQKRMFSMLELRLGGAIDNEY